MTDGRAVNTLAQQQRLLLAVWEAIPEKGCVATRALWAALEVAASFPAVQQALAYLEATGAVSVGHHGGESYWWRKKEG